MKNKPNPLSSLQPKNTVRFFYVSVVLCISAFTMLLMAIVITYDNRAGEITYEASKPFLTNESVRMGSTEILISNVRRTEGMKPFVAPEGYEYVIATVALHNISDTPIQVIPTLDLYLKSNQGEVSYLSMYGHKAPLDAGELPAGDRLQGDVAFMAKRGEQAKLYIDAAWSGSTLAFDLQ